MRYLCQVGLCVLFFTCEYLYADEIIQKSTKVLGKEVSVSQILSSNKDSVDDEISDSGIQTSTQLVLFGKKIEIAKSSVKYKVAESDGLSYNNTYYVKGKKVLASSSIDKDGSNYYSLDIPYAEISGDVVSYSLGILKLGINTGVSYEGKLKSHVSSEFLKKDPILGRDMNLVEAALEADVMAKGFIEGQVKVLFLKAGVGGAINLIEGQSKAAISVIPSTIIDPTISYSGIAHLLSGQLYAYIGSGSSRWLSKNFYKSQGYCRAVGESTCEE